MGDSMQIYVSALRNLAKIRHALRDQPAGVEDVDRVIEAVLREMATA